MKLINSGLLFLAALLLVPSAYGAQLLLGNVALIDVDGRPTAVTFRVDADTFINDVPYKGFPDAVEISAGWHTVSVFAAGDPAQEVLVSRSFFLPSEEDSLSLLAAGGSQGRSLQLITRAIDPSCADIACTGTINLSPAAERLSVERRCRDIDAPEDNTSLLAGPLPYGEGRLGSSSIGEARFCELSVLADDEPVSWQTTTLELPATGLSTILIIGDNVLARPEIIAVADQALVPATEVTPDPIAGITSVALWRDLDEPGAAYFLLELPEAGRVTGTALLFNSDGNSEWRAVDGAFQTATDRQAGTLRLSQLGVSRAEGGQIDVASLPNIQLVYDGCNRATVTLIDDTLTTRRIERTLPVSSCLVPDP
ncbi:MAG: DUF4397 domain-containing protein [Pseudomonadota bacterium]